MDIEITLDQFVKTLTAYRVELPTVAADALATLAAIRGAGAGLTLAAAETLAAQAVADGEVTAKNAEAKLNDLATRMLAVEKAREAAQLFTRPLLVRARQAIREHSDELAVALRVPFDASAALLHEHGPRVEPGMSAADLVQEGSQAVAAYEETRGHSAALEQIVSLYRTLYQLSGVIDDIDAATVVDPASVADGAALDRAMFAYNSPSYQRSGPVSRLHSVVYAGFRLRLNLPSEARELVNTVRQNASNREQQEQLARRLANQRNEIYMGGSAA